MTIDNHHLRVFVAVSLTGNVARAAELLQLTASPVSRALRELERQTGPLFERAYHDMRRLPRGDVLLPLAVDALQLADDFEDAAGERAPTLRFAMTPWVPSWCSDRFLTATERAPLPAVEHDSAVSSTLLNRLRHGALDLALVHLPVEIPGVSTRPVTAYDLQLLVPVGDPLEQQATPEGVPISAVAGRKFLLTPASMQPVPSQALRDWLIEAGAAEVAEASPADLPFLRTRLRRSGALGVSPGIHDLPGRDDRVVRIPLIGAHPDFQVGVAWRTVNPSRIPAIETLIDGFAAAVAAFGPAG